jgi:hypothetical protein
MKTFDVQGVDLRVPRGRAFAYIADPGPTRKPSHRAPSPPG